jgi:hypothetical protein
MASSNNNFKPNYNAGSSLEGVTPHCSIFPSRLVLKLE